MAYKIKHQNRIARDFKKGLDFNFIAFKYGVPVGDVFLSVERQRLKRRK